MQNFAVTDRSEQRVKGEFEIKPTPTGYTPTAAEEQYINRLQEALAKLVADEVAEQDLDTFGVRFERSSVRETAVASLRSDAAGSLSADAATQKIEEILKKYQEELSKLPDGRPRFSTTEVGGRFPGFFEIEEIQWRPALSANDQSYLEQAQQLLRELNMRAGEDRDSLEPNSPRMTQRIEARKQAAWSLKQEVDSVETRQKAEKSAETLKKIKENLDKTLEGIDRPKFKIEDRETARFVGDFRISVIDEPNRGSFVQEVELNRERYIYVAQVDDILRNLATDEKEDNKYSGSIGAERIKLRNDAADDLKRRAEAVSKGNVYPIAAANAASTLQGKYLLKLELASGTLFTISVDPDEEEAKTLKIVVAKNLLPPNNVVPQEKQELYTTILGAETVIKTVCDRIEGGEDQAICGRIFAKKTGTQAQNRANRLRGEYLKKLVEIGRLGLEGPHTVLAKVALESLRNEFVAHEGPRIKNSYACRLGLVCGLTAAALLLLYLLIRTKTSFLEQHFWQEHSPFLLVGIGAAIGTWLSFSIRKVELSFDHLGIVEADLLDPAFRVLFVVALAITACLLFWTGVMNIEIGALKTTSVALKQAGTIALVIGVFCGLSERALATAISGRAATFVKGISAGA